MPRRTKRPPAGTESLLETLVAQIDRREGEERAADTVPTGFASVDRILAGDLSDIIDALTAHDQAARLAAQE